MKIIIDMSIGMICTIVAQKGGSVAKAARQQLENQLGRSVISPLNAKGLLPKEEEE